MDTEAFLQAAAVLEHEAGIACGGCRACREEWSTWFVTTLDRWPDLLAKVTKENYISKRLFDEALRRLEAELAILEGTP